MKNAIVLIGMPGSGKTILGKKLAQLIGYNFVDMDEFIVSGCGKSIQELFSKGEEVFRDKETESCALISKLENVVVSSGGGVVKRPENMEYFKDFLTIFINRPLELIIEDIDTTTRPLLKNGKDRLTNLYRERIDLYNAYKDIEVVNDGTIDQVLEDLEGAVKNEIYGD